ncbi:MAG TPA: hypothetical protein VKU00_26060 [Chthonomonadaceae bacterium]|nr:hypothetical protein [Chthonomonadaceae bacterium]
MSFVRKQLYYAAKALSRSRSPRVFEARLREYHAGIPAETTSRRLTALLRHCAANVPYYAALIEPLGGFAACERDPQALLRQMPILTKAILREQVEALKSRDYTTRRWYVNTSGGSTGEPVRLIQDEDYRACASANTLLFSALAGKTPGKREVRLWGSERDIFEGSVGWKGRLTAGLTNTVFLNAFRMTPETMREYLARIQSLRPKLILAYAQALYELAQFAERERIPIAPQYAIITSAGTLYPFMKDTLKRVFGCPVYNRYGSREVGDIASELPGREGLWVPPWNNYVEIVDEAGCPVEPGEEGHILVTCLTNFSMPLLRYQIGDTGILATEGMRNLTGQVLERVTGRVTDNFRTRQGRVIPGEYFIHLIGVVLNQGFLQKFQIVQTDYDRITLKLVTGGETFDTTEMAAKIKLVMDPDCQVQVEFVEDIPPLASGKYRYTISEVPH